MHRQSQWKHKVQEVLQGSFDEIKKTTLLGKRMLNASKTNSCLHKAYEDLGRLVMESYNRGDMNLPDYKARELVETINYCESELKAIEQEMQKIKFASGPEVVCPEDFKNTTKH